MACIVLVLIVLALVAEGFCFTSFKAPAETIKNYEVHTPILHNMITEGQQQSIDLELSHFVIHLELNSNLVPSQFTSHYYDADGNAIVKKGHVNCFYHGTVSGHPEWHVAMSTCRGLQGSFGELGSIDNYYHLEPLDWTNGTLQQPHVLYTAAEYSKREGTCGVSGHATKYQPSSTAPHQIHMDANRVRRLVNGFNVVELAMVNDLAQFNAFQRDQEATVMRALEIANVMDSLFIPLGVRVVVVDITTWSSGDQIQYPPDNEPSVLLRNFQDFEPQITAVHDSTMLITGTDLPGQTRGFARIGTMCEGRSAVGLTQDYASADTVGAIAAHELGHIFSMEHDNNTCTCDDPTGSCIMAAFHSSLPSMWSSCSRNFIRSAFARDNLDSCLGNEPLVTVADPVCGNGIRERDEICDCGTSEECTDLCCNATLCTLQAGAQCSSGTGDCCGDNCQFKPLGTACRPATQECDSPEFCIGNSSSCPTDAHLRNGSPCNQGSDFCYSGVCQTLDAQCQRFFGSTAGIPQCISNNIEGVPSGNCGYSRGDYIACTPQDAQCGQLQCAAECERQCSIADTNCWVQCALRNFMLRGEFVVYTDPVRNGDGNFEHCFSFTPNPPNSDTLSPGLVADGTKCGNSSVCVSQSCTPVSSLLSFDDCPMGSNGMICSGNGVCNNLNQCSCDAGVLDAACETANSKGGGGGNAGAIVGALIGVLLAIALAVAVVLIGWKVLQQSRRHRPRRSGTSPSAFSKSKPTASTPKAAPPPPKQRITPTPSTRTTASLHPVPQKVAPNKPPPPPRPPAPALAPHRPPRPPAPSLQGRSKQAEELV